VRSAVGWVYASFRRAQYKRQAQHGVEIKEQLVQQNRLG